MLTLGLELISSEAVALSELVKNSYDADASTVVISLRDGTPEGPASLTVLDDGVGMSSDTVMRTWLEPATPSRRRRKVSPTGRRSLGEPNRPRPR
ncbi:ATP-binding protein [Planotetraspora phitsanulokensis]